jgi:hypothetical protein
MPSRPRPILKRVLSSNKQSEHGQPLPFATCVSILSPHVHFPPTPSMVASTHPVHSPQTDDRKPIVVSPNHCAIPKRGAKKLYSPPADFEVERPQRGRRVRQANSNENVKGSYFHPRAFEACEPEPIVDDALEQLSPPLLVRDLSNSDEYDSADSSDEENVTTPPDPKHAVVVSIADPSSDSAMPRLLGRESKGSPVEDKARPMLVRSSKRPSVRFSSSREQILLPASLDHGCLGGF